MAAMAAGLLVREGDARFFFRAYARTLPTRLEHFPHFWPEEQLRRLPAKLRTYVAKFRGDVLAAQLRAVLRLVMPPGAGSGAGVSGRPLARMRARQET